MKVALITLSAIALFAGAANATEICKPYDKTEWMTEEAITAKAVEMGYEVAGVKVEDGCWEIKGKKDGARVDAYFDPKTAEVVLTK